VRVVFVVCGEHGHACCDGVSVMASFLGIFPADGIPQVVQASIQSLGREFENVWWRLVRRTKLESLAKELTIPLFGAYAGR
jgi:hypothetical protein